MSSRLGDLRSSRNVSGTEVVINIGCSKILTLSCHTPHSCQPASASFNPQNPQREVPLLMNELGPRCLGLKQSWRLKSPEPIVILTGCAAPRRLRVLACEAPQIIDQDRDSENECSRRYIYPIACELGTHELAGGITSASGLRPFQQTDEVSRTGINSDGSSTVAFNRARAALRFGCEGPDQRPQESQLNMHSLPVEHPLLHSYRKNYFGAHFSLQFLKATLELSLFRSSNSHLPLSIWPISLRASRTQHLALAWQGQADSQRIERHRHAQLKLLWVLSHVWVFRGVCSAPRHS